MANDQNSTAVTLPADLSRRFAELRQRLGRVETTVAAGCAVGGLLLSYLLVFVSDRFWDTPGWLRAVFLIGGAAVLAAAGVRWYRKWLRKRGDLRALAVLVQRRYRLLGDRLLGIVELVDEKQRPTDYSPALYQAAIKQVAEETAGYDFTQAVDSKPARWSGVFGGSLVVLGLAPWLLVPAAGWNAMQRWLQPAGSTPRYTLVNLKDVPAEQIVPHGESFTVECQVEYRSFWQPGQALCQYARQSPIEGEVQNGRVTFEVPGQVQSGILTLRVGDAREELEIKPTHRPSLKQLTATIHLPDYLQHPPVEEPVNGGTLEVLEGSRVSFHGQVSRTLQSASFRLGEDQPNLLKVSGTEFHTDPVGLDTVFQCAFNWEDQLGLTNSAPWRLTIEPLKDRPPQPGLPEQPRQMAVLESEVVELRARARDDYGVRRLGLNWEVAGDWQTNQSGSGTEFVAEAATPQEAELSQRFYFSPTVLQIPADSTVEIKAYATDYYPGREPDESAVHRIHILGVEQHAEMVRQNLESLLTRLEDITRLEEEIAVETDELKELSEEEWEANKGEEQLAETAAEQEQNKSQLDEMSKEGMRMMQEALRNPVFSEATLQEWTKTLHEMQQLSQQQMSQAAQSLQSARQNTPQRSEQLSEAQRQEQQALEALKQMQQNVNEGLDQLEALTLAQRLRQLGSEESRLAGQLRDLVPETIGLLPDQLPEKFREANSRLAENQAETQEEAGVLQEEISRYFERTRQENYGEVSREMKEAQTPEQLAHTGNQIQKNISMKAMENLADWSRRFEDWAEKLEPPEAGGGGGGSGGSGGDDQGMDLMKQLMALLRLREGEINLRQQTRLMDERKAETEQYRKGSETLAEKQGTLREKLTEVQQEIPLATLNRPLQETDHAMRAAQDLLMSSQTGEPTEQAQTQSVQLLSDVINLINEQQQQQQGQGQQQSAASQQMAFLLQQMAQQQGMARSMSPSQTPGGNRAGGSTDQAASPLQGGAAGRAPEARDVSQASGVTREVPTEFRDALQDYYRAIEQSENGM